MKILLFFIVNNFSSDCGGKKGKDLALKSFAHKHNLQDEYSACSNNKHFKTILELQP
jgi:hypothetical protein